MAIEGATRPDADTEWIKEVPQERRVRLAIRRRAEPVAHQLQGGGLLQREVLERQGEGILTELGLPRRYLGFAMVAVSNAYWHDSFRQVPFGRRLLLLPKCLSSSEVCKGTYDSIGLHCAGCGACSIANLKARAESLGYSVIVAEGTSSALLKVMEGEADAILGVACLDSLEKSFARVVELGIPHMAVPLLRDGCANTEAEMEEIETLLLARGGVPRAPARSYVPLLRETHRLFEEDSLRRLLSPYVEASAWHEPPDAPLDATEAIAWRWVREGGKRLRPFVTLAAYAVARHGTAALLSNAPLADWLPDSIRRVALAIEVLHKASLVHDDIEDEDAFRYGKPTLHRVHGIAAALNVGDYLVGLGYRLVAGEADTLGCACVADILARLSAAHLELCRGQGAELAWQATDTASHPLPPREVLAIYALKTAPAFEVALAAGLQAAHAPFSSDVVRRFSLYLGEAYQIRNDLEDWENDEKNKVNHGQDALGGRPTLLRAFAEEAGAGPQLTALLASQARHGDPRETLRAVREIYQSSGAFRKAEALLARLRERALSVAEEAQPKALRELLSFLVRIILAGRGATAP